MVPIVATFCTCDTRLATTRQFIASFQRIQHLFRHTFIVLDLSTTVRCSNEYLRLLASLDASTLVVHPRTNDVRDYDSVMWGQSFALQTAVAESQEGEHVMFMEDDIIFSSRFAAAVQAYRPPANLGFLSLYQPGHGWPAGAIDAHTFYGCQCLLFSRRAVTAIVDHQEQVMNGYNPGMDIRWSRYLHDQRFRLYCLEHSLVQHQASQASISKHHQSMKFLP